MGEGGEYACSLVLHQLLLFLLFFLLLPGASGQRSVLHHAGGDHLVEGVVPAVLGGDEVHDRGADVLLLEPGLHQVRNLGLLRGKRDGGGSSDALRSLDATEAVPSLSSCSVGMGRLQGAPLGPSQCSLLSSQPSQTS